MSTSFKPFSKRKRKGLAGRQSANNSLHGVRLLSVAAPFPNNGTRRLTLQMCPARALVRESAIVPRNESSLRHAKTITSPPPPLSLKKNTKTAKHGNLNRR